MSKKPVGDDVVTPPPRRLSSDEPTTPMSLDGAGGDAPRARADEPTPTLNVAPGSSGKAKIPTQIGRYQILERVGKGGMGVLYRGIDPVLDREVAIKLMLGDFSDDTEQLRPRFYREARAVARLQHRNIVTVFEFAEDGTTPYIVMEFLRGASLSARMDTPPPLTLEDKIDIVAQLCAGLGYAHEQGIVHRDVKPANVFVLTDGTIKLLDFGIAKLTTSNLTRQGDVLGSPSYMSPEQIMGRENVDGRADVFSTGVMLYELLTSRKPFEAESTTGIVLKILNEQPPAIEALDPAIPPALCAVVRKALEKDPAKRFESAIDFARELQTVRRSLSATDMRTIAMSGPIGPATLAGKSPIPKPQPAPPAAGRRWMLPAVIGSGVIAAGIVAALVMGRPSAPSKPQPSPPAAASSAGTASPAATTGGAATGVAATGATAVVSPPDAKAGGERKEQAATKIAASAAATVQQSTVQILSEPAGAAITVDGRDTKLVTPAQLTMGVSGSHRLRLSKRGFQTMDARLAAPDLRKGSLSYTLAPAEAAPAAAAAIAVTASGAYPFAIYDGGRVVSASSTSHQLSVAAGKKLRLVAPEYLLNQVVTVDRTDDKQADFQAPALANVTIRSNQETCKVKIGDRDLGYPPINNLKMAGGSYQVDVVCPNGQSKTQFINVTPGAQNARVILQ